jgi:hypothetical protein
MLAWRISILVLALAVVACSLPPTAPAQEQDYRLAAIDDEELPVVHSQLWNLCRTLPGQTADSDCEPEPTGCFIVTREGEITLTADGHFRLTIPRHNTCTGEVTQEFVLTGDVVRGESSPWIVLVGPPDAVDPITIEGFMGQRVLVLTFAVSSLRFERGNEQS